MKKYHIAAFTVVMLAFPVMAYAVGQGNGQGMTQEDDSVLIETSNKMMVTPAGGVANQNEVKTQNQGEENMIRVSEMEDENDEGTNGGQFGENRNQKAYEHMSIVAQKVQGLQMMGEREDGIGEQVREFARTQNQSQEKIQAGIDSLDKRQQWMKVFIGPDFEAIKNIRMEIKQNQIRIQQLEQLQIELVNQGDISSLEETIQALVSQNEALLEKVMQEEQTKSMFGWLFRFFEK